MASMSYCKFENTLTDLRQCLSALKEEKEIGSEYERQAFQSMMEEIVEFLMDEEIIGHTDDCGEPVWDKLDIYVRDALNFGKEGKDE